MKKVAESLSHTLVSKKKIFKFLLPQVSAPARGAFRFSVPKFRGCGRNLSSCKFIDFI